MVDQPALPTLRGEGDAPSLSSGKVEERYQPDVPGGPLKGPTTSAVIQPP